MLAACSWLATRDVRTADPSADGRGSAASRTAIGGGTSSRRLRGDSLFYHQRGLLQLIHVTRQWFHLEPRTVTESHNTNTGLLFGIAFGSFGTQDVGAEYGHTAVARGPVGHCGQLCAIAIPFRFESLSRCCHQKWLVLKSADKYRPSRVTAALPLYIGDKN